MVIFKMGRSHTASDDYERPLEQQTQTLEGPAPPFTLPCALELTNANHIKGFLCALASD